MNSDLAAQFLHHLDFGELSVGHAPDDVKAWLEDLDIPMDLRRLMQWTWPQKFCLIAGIAIYTSRDIQKFENIDIFLANKLFPLGHSKCGDEFALDFSVESFPVGFVRVGDYSEDNPRELLNYVARSLETFLYRVTEGKFVPYDADSAYLYNIFLKDEATHECFPPYRPILSPEVPPAGERGAPP
ncbi:MAG: hypothetical protein ACAH88_20150 [Roseimicrobium sp.]